MHGFLFGLAPSGVYLADVCYHQRGALLPHLFTLTELVIAVALYASLASGSRNPHVLLGTLPLLAPRRLA